MAYWLALFLFLGLFAQPAPAQRPELEKTPDQTLPSPSKVLKAQHEEIKKMSTQLATLATEVEEELQKSGENVLPLNTLKKLDEIEKLARKLRGRIKQL